MKYLSIIYLILSSGSLAAQDNQSLRLFNEYPLKEKTDYFVKKIWLNKKLWDFIDDESGRAYFYSRSHAKSAEIRLIPVFTPSKKTIDGYDSTKNILDFLVADPNRCYMAVVSKNKKMICLVEAWRRGKNNRGRIDYSITNFEENKQDKNFYKALADGSLVYYDSVVRMYYRVENNEVFVYYGYKRDWVPYYELIGKDGLNGYKELVKSRAKK